jgi:Phage tail assembly chaperone
MPLLNRDTVLGKKKLRQEVVPIPEWDGEVIVRELRGDERSRYEAGFTDAVMGEETTVKGKTKRYESMRAKIVVMTCINEDGTHLFDENDVEEVNQLSGAALDRIFSTCMRLSGYTKEEQEKLKKNSVDPEPLNLH